MVIVLQSNDCCVAEQWLWQGTRRRKCSNKNSNHDRTTIVRARVAEEASVTARAVDRARLTERAKAEATTVITETRTQSSAVITARGEARAAGKQ
jgi:hypothetical protein